MKKRYQNTKRRAADQFVQWAKTNEEPIQLTIPTAGIAEVTQQSLGDLLRSVGKIFIHSVMESEVSNWRANGPSGSSGAGLIAGGAKRASASSMASGFPSTGRTQPAA